MTDDARPEVTIVVRDPEVTAIPERAKTELVDAGLVPGVRTRESGRETERDRPTMIR
jgi:hypothetical protein